MRAIWKAVAAAGFGVAAFSATAAFADDDRGRGRGWDDDRDRGGYSDYRPDRCDDDHDHRRHDARYYDYYPADRYYRAGPYGGGYDDRYDRGRGRGYDDRYGYDRGSRVIRRDVFNTRYRARIFLVEEEFYSRRGARRICTLDVRGPDKRYVPYGYVRSLANRACSRRSEIRII